MRFKILTANSGAEVREEIARFKLVVDERKITNIQVAGSEGSWVITIAYKG